MTWQTLALRLGFLLLWAATTGGQTTTGNSTTKPPIISPVATAAVIISSSPDPPTGNNSTTLPAVSSEATTAEIPSSIPEITIESSSSETPFITVLTPETTSSIPDLTTGVLECNLTCADNELCTNSAGQAECKCQPMKYINASRSDLVPVVQCEGSAMTLSLSKCLLERFNYNFTQMHFKYTNCTETPFLKLVGNERVAQIKAIQQAGWCGNEMTINNDTTVTYSNVLYIPPDDTRGIIVSSTLMFNFSCTYNMTMQTSLLTALHPIIGPVTLPSVNGSGPTTATMAAFKSNSFTDPLTEDDTLTVGTPLFIGIATTFSDGDRFTLKAERCVAAPSNNSTYPSVELISGGCAVAQDVNVHVIENGQSMQVMFEIETFIFKGHPDVYMWCDVSLCPTTPPNTCPCSSSS